MLAVNVLSQPKITTHVAGVSDRQARRYKESGLAPAPVQRLMALHMNGRILPDSKDWGRWRFMETSSGIVLASVEFQNIAFTANELRCWWFERQELTRRRHEQQEMPAQYMLRL